MMCLDCNKEMKIYEGYCRYDLKEQKHEGQVCNKCHFKDYTEKQKDNFRRFIRDIG